MSDPWTPRNLTEFVGQRGVMEQLEVRLAAAMARKAKGLPWAFHVICIGPPGLGKSSLAPLVATQLGLSWWRTQGSQLRAPEAVAEWMRRVKRAGGEWLWVVDEGHLAGAGCLEDLFPILERGEFEETQVPLMVWITANDSSSLPTPLLSRCTLLEFGYYLDHELQQIAIASAQRAGFTLTPEGATLLASGAWGEPRRVNHLLSHTLDSLVASKRDHHRVDVGDVQATFTRLCLHQGLTETQVSMLRHLRAARRNRLGLRTLAGLLARSEKDVASRIEPHLLRSGMVSVVTGGRELSEAGLQLLGTLESR